MKQWRDKWKGVVLDIIRIFETSDEYLLEIPAREKERARKIEGRIWDAKRRCWVYPKTEEKRKELLNEFSNDLSDENLHLLSISDTSPSTLKESQLKQVEIGVYEKSKNNSLSTEESQAKSSTNPTMLISHEKFIEFENEIKNFLELEHKLAEKDKNIIELKVINASLQAEAEKLHKEYEKLRELEQQIIDKDNNIKELSELNESLQAKVQKLNATIGNNPAAAISKQPVQSSRQPKRNLDDQIKSLAIKLAKPSIVFESFVNSHSEIDLRLISDFITLMDMRFREMLNISSSEKNTLVNLINKSKDEGYITTEAATLAHYLRKERNRMIHNDTFTAPLKKHFYRYLLIAALLWADLGG